jgi:thiamine-monophosphate kinase
MDLIITKDALVGGVHFFENDKPNLIAQKALRVNLSDLAAMGAEPIGYFLSIALPKEDFDIDSWVSSFTEGLLKDQREFGWQLWGGDTVSTTGPVTISITAIGQKTKNHNLTRSGASPDDVIYVSGNLGDSAAGLLAIKKGIDIPELIERYHLPIPRVELGRAIIGIATSALDISDGLMSDIKHICEQSAVGVEIFLNNLPVSSSLKEFLKSNLFETKHDYSHLIWNGGDDYELLFTAREKDKSNVEEISRTLGVKITEIGKITSGNKVILYDTIGKELKIENTGFSHF